MQKLINVLSLISFGVSAVIVGGGAYLYLNKDALIEKVKEQATEEITKALTDALPSMINGAMPEIPSMTGGAVPESLPATTGLPIPGM